MYSKVSKSAILAQILFYRFICNFFIKEKYKEVSTLYGILHKSLCAACLNVPEEGDLSLLTFTISYTHIYMTVYLWFIMFFLKEAKKNVRIWDRSLHG